MRLRIALIASVLLGALAPPAWAKTTLHPHWHPSRAWLRQASCIRWNESRDRWRINTGNGYFGAYQFLPSTWRSVGGHGWPNLAPPREQSYRAWRVWKRDGGWREWSTGPLCY